MLLNTSWALCDNWDQHWSDFNTASEMGPATKYRQQLCLRLLGIRNSGQGVRMLDIGSGAGGFASLFCGRYPCANFLGLELSRTGVELAGLRVPHAQFQQCDLLAPPDDPPCFGATHATCSEVLEHLDDPVTFLRNATCYMAPGCKLVVTVPGGKPNAFDLHIGHRRHFTPRGLRDLLQQAGFEVVQATGAGFPFFNLYRLLTTWRGEKLKEDVSGPPSPLVRAGTLVFGMLFRLNLTNIGWQTVAEARYLG